MKNWLQFFEIRAKDCPQTLSRHQESRPFQSVATFALFFLSSTIDVYTHLGIMITFLALSNIAYTVATRRYGKNKCSEALSDSAELTEKKF